MSNNKLMVANVDEALGKTKALADFVSELNDEFNKFVAATKETEDLGVSLSSLRDHAEVICARLKDANEQAHEAVKQMNQMAEEVKLITEANISL